MELKELQKEVDGWISQYKAGYWPPLSIMAQISEETGELAKELNNNYGGRVKKDLDKDTKISAEICDIFWALICLANSHNIDLEKAWKESITKRCNRDKDRFEKVQIIE